MADPTPKTVEDLMAMLKRIEDADASMRAMRQTLEGLRTGVMLMNQAMTDMLAHVEKMGPATIKAMAEGLKAAQVGSVTVEAAPLQVMQSPHAGYTVETSFNPDGSQAKSVVKPIPRTLQ